MPGGLARGQALPPADAEAPLLPRSLEEALGALEADEVTGSWWSAEAKSAYLAFKRAEIKALDGATPEEICARYAEVY